MQNLDPALYQDIVDSLPDGLWLSDHEHRIVYANPAMAAIAGIPQENIIGANVLTDFGEETVSNFRHFYMAAVDSGKPTKYECLVVTPAGRQTWQGGWLTPRQKDGKFSGIVCTVQDLSLAKHSKLLQQAGESRFRDLLEAIPCVAVQGYGPDGTTHYWNQASERLYGYSAEEAIGRNLLELIVPAEIREHVAKLIRKTYETGQPIPAGELSLLRKDGSSVAVFSSHAYVHVPGQEAEMFCVDIDLTELKRAEQTLRRRESYQRALLDNFPFMVWLKDEQSRFLAVNRAFAKAFEWPSPASLVGRNDFDITTPEQAELYRADDQAVMDSRTNRQTEELSGSPEQQYWVETYKSPVIIDGKVTGTVGFARDITARKKVEMELLAAKAEAEAANRSKSNFLAAASHDLRQPLSALSLYVGLLKAAAPTECVELVNNIQNCVGSLSELLTDLLDVSKLEAGVVVPKQSDFAIDDLLASLVALHAAEAEEKGLRLRRRPSRALVRSDPQLLRRILGNLIANAVRYTRHGGVLIACRRHQGRCWIEVWDTGIGIPAEKTGVIFEEFTQLGVDPLSRGSGLGLAIVAKIAALLGLQIRLNSRPGRGSMFAIELPDGEAPPSAQPLPSPRSSRQLRIALVDDNPQVLRALALTLQSAGHQVVAASDGQSLFEQLNGNAPDILISDYRLGLTESGFDVIQAAKNRFGADLPAFIITGDTDPAIIRSMSGRGIAVHYKPLSMESLQAIISEAVERSPS